MTAHLTQDEAELVVRLLAAAAALHAMPLYPADALASLREAALAISRIAEEREEARKLNNKYAWERDKAREERDAAERRSEAHWGGRAKP